MKKLMLLLAAASLAATASLNAASSFGEPEISRIVHADGRMEYKIVPSATSCCGEATYKTKLAAMQAKLKELQDAADAEYAGRSLLSRAGSVISRRPVALGGKKPENMGVVASSDVSFKPAAPAMTVAPAEAPAPVEVTPIPESRFSKVKTAAAVTAAGLIPAALCRPTVAYTAPYAEALWHAAKEKATAGVALATPYVQDAANYVATKAAAVPTAIAASPFAIPAKYVVTNAPVVATAIAASPYAIPAAYVAGAGAAGYGVYRLGKYAFNKYVARKIAAADMEGTEGTLSNAPAVATPSTDSMTQVGENITNPTEQQQAQADLAAMAKPSRIKAFGRWIKANKGKIALGTASVALAAAYVAWTLSMRSQVDNGMCGASDMDTCDVPGFSRYDFLKQVTTCFKGTEAQEWMASKTTTVDQPLTQWMASKTTTVDQPLTQWMASKTTIVNQPLDHVTSFMESAGAGFKYTPFAPVQKAIPGMIGTVARAFSRN